MPNMIDYTDYLMLRELEESQRNRQIAIKSNQYSSFTLSQNAVYYPYNHDVDDRGWGCAWRAIQTLLSNHHIRVSFPELYATFSNKHRLIQIVRLHRQLPQGVLEQLETAKWAPQDLDNHWAEPFIGSLICWQHKLPNKLLLLNGYPQAYAPKGVFESVLTFGHLTQLIKANINTTSIMIDDGRFALSIVGMRSSTPQTIELLFADPHINCNRQDKDVGLYRKSFDLDGKPLQIDTRSEGQKKEALYNVYECLDFQSKAWMICLVVT